MRDALYDGRPFRTLNVIDEGNREALRIECGTSISAHRLTRVMSELVEVYGKPNAIRLDKGPEMTSHHFMDWAKDNQIELLFIQPGKPNQNAFIERFNRSFRNEVLDANLFNSVSEAQAAADEWVTDYNECRSHESLGNVPPVQYMPRDINGLNLYTYDLSTKPVSLRIRSPLRVLVIPTFTPNSHGVLVLPLAITSASGVCHLQINQRVIDKSGATS